MVLSIRDRALRPAFTHYEWELKRRARRRLETMGRLSVELAACRQRLDAIALERQAKLHIQEHKSRARRALNKAQ